jgi:hypothetical protein
MLGSALVALALAGSTARAATPDQATDNSTGAAQVGPVKANAPVRVLSDGDNQAGAQGGSTGEQSATDSEGAAQVGPVDLDAPVRIASDGDNQGDAQAKGGSQGIDNSTGAAQVGPVKANAPVRVLSDGDNQAGDRPGASPPGEEPAGSTQPNVNAGEEPQGETEAAGELASVNTPNGSGPLAAALSAEGALPFTGLNLWVLLVIGAWALASGYSVRSLTRDAVRMSL